MNENGAAKTPTDGGWSGTQKVLSGLLVVFTLVLGLVCVFLLACTLTQSRLSSIALSGVNVSIWKLDDVRKQWQALRTQVNVTADKLSEVEQNKISVSNEYSSFYAKEYRPARTELDAKLGPFIARVKAVDAQLASDFSREEDGPVEHIERIESQRVILVDQHPELKQAVDEITSLGDKYKPIDQLRIRFTTTLSALNDQESSLNKYIEALTTSLDNLFFAQFGVKVDPPTRVRIENALFELYSGSVLGSMIASILVLPPEILTLLLVLLMGILGSSLQLTHQLFMRNEVDSIGAYSLRLAVGAITALVIFIVAKAGAPVLTDASKLGGDTPINPYFVSFLAIISGLMSEQAIASVQSLAERYFQTEKSQVARWALPALAQAFGKTQRNTADLARDLEVSTATLTKYLSGKEPIPVSAQKMLAAVVNRSMRDLFSDMPPEETETQSEPAEPELKKAQENPTVAEAVVAAGLK
jgi:transcriptional regulator with XRE-family HTH domain